MQSNDTTFELDIAGGKLLVRQSPLWHDLLPAGCELDYQPSWEAFVCSKVPPPEQARLLAASCINSLRQAFAEGRHFVNHSFRTLPLPKGGSYGWFGLSIIINQSSGHALGKIEDLQQRRKQAAREEYHIDHDLLTDVLNRYAFESQLAEQLNNYERGVFAIVDVDNFFEINVLQGQMLSNQLLVELAQIIEKSLPPEGLIGRFGGDEFCLFVGDANQRQAESLLQELVENVRISQLSATVSIGAALFPDYYFGQPKTLAYCAEIALLQQKLAGKNNFRFFCDSRLGRAPYKAKQQGEKNILSRMRDLFALPFAFTAQLDETSEWLNSEPSDEPHEQDVC